MSESKNKMKKTNKSGSRQNLSEQNTDNESLVTELAFLEVCNAFEKILQSFNRSENQGIIYDKLNKIKNLIEMKISPLDKELSLLEKSCASSLTLSCESLGPLQSSDQILKNYMSQMFCPFCSEIQEDEMALVKHLDESCQPYRRKEFAEEKDLPFATFQILPCDKIKCNICLKSENIEIFRLNDHSQDLHHLKAYAAATKRKSFDMKLFCSCCEILINYSFKEILFHIQLAVHKKNASDKKSASNFRGQGIQFVFKAKKKLKCLNCSASNHFTNTQNFMKWILSHSKACKKKGDRIEIPQVYCEICAIKVNLGNVDGHFLGVSHQTNEKGLKKSNFKSCFYCVLIFDSLMSLALHMDSKCPEINKIRRKLSEK